MFAVDAQRCALELAQVERVIRMVALTPLPGAPAVILGMFELEGELLPVASVRRRLLQPDRPIRAGDQLAVVRARGRRLALAFDAAVGVLSVDPSRIEAAHHLTPGLEKLRGVARLEQEGLVLVHDIDAFLSLAEEAQTEAALRDARP